MKFDNIQSVAERTFLDLISLWAGYDTEFPVIQFYKQCHYYQVTLPSLWHEVPDLRTSWIVLASEALLMTKDINLKCECFKFSLELDVIENYQELCRIDQRIYLCLAVRKKDLFDLTEYYPLDRFEWYVVCLNQVFRTRPVQNGQTSISVPKHNFLNLALFSLIWSAQWISEYHLPFYDKHIIHNPRLMREIQRISSAYFGTDERVIKKQKQFLSTDLLNFKNDFDQFLNKQLFLRLCLIVGLNEINYKMSSLGEIDEIFIYAPEALFGTANFWLFSGAYHNYMRISSKAASQTRNIHLLPVHTSKIEGVPPILRCSIWHVLIYYSKLKLDVGIVRASNYEPGKDRNYFGGGIGHYPWLTISISDLELDYTRNKIGDIGENRDFLQYQYKQKIINIDFGLTEVAKTLNINRPNQLELSVRKPLLLFPEEDLYFEHPNILWNLPY